jgi:glucokinase
MAGLVRGLVGDIGGTNARFALAEVGADGSIRLDEPLILPAADYSLGREAVRAFLSKLKPAERPPLAVLAAAGPVTGGAVRFTNNEHWRFEEEDLRSAFGFAGVRLINDFTAEALAIDHLEAADIRQIGPAGTPAPRATAAVLGPGTGFGAAALVDDGANRAVLTSEAGHAGFAPSDDDELEILRRLMVTHGRTSIERVLSGPGLLSLYRTLARMRGEPAPLDHPDAVSRAGLAGEPLARAVLDRFCGILGAVAGDLALTTGARRGVYISGGIAPAIISLLESSAFRARFEAKGRMSDYVKAIPTYVVTAPYAAMVGAASLLPTLGPAA